VNNYELTVILRTKNSESLKEKVKEILTKFNVTITEEAHWGSKRLAYEIDGEKEGFYFFAYVQTSPNMVEKVTADLKRNQDILRIMFVKIQKPQTS
jgi:small subunit ribosomal protein S6